MKIIKASLNKDCKHETFNFKDNPNGFDKVLSFCDNCEFFDIDRDFSNCFCDKSNDMIDFWSCLKKCPCGLWKLEEIKNREE